LSDWYKTTEGAFVDGCGVAIGFPDENQQKGEFDPCFQADGDCSHCNRFQDGRCAGKNDEDDEYNLEDEYDMDLEIEDESNQKECVNCGDIHQEDEAVCAKCLREIMADPYRADQDDYYPPAELRGCY